MATNHLERVEDMSTGNCSAGGFGRRGVVAESREQPVPRGPDRVSTNLILAFIGDNIERFKPTVDAMAKRSDTLSVPVIGWCWPAFFFNYLWLAYRRMYVAAAGAWVILMSALTTVGVMTPIPTYIYGPATMVLCALFGKSLYVMLAARRVRLILEEEGNPTAAVISVRARGGTSWRAVIGALILVFLVQIFIVMTFVGYVRSNPDALGPILEFAKKLR